MLLGLFVVVATLLTGARFGPARGRRLAPATPLHELVRDLRWAPTDWLLWYEVGRRCCEAARRMPDRAAGEAWSVLGRDSILQAATYNPTSYEVWIQLARVESGLGNAEAARYAADRALALRPYLGGRIEELLRVPSGSGEG
jgi:hypothetical protein